MEFIVESFCRTTLSSVYSNASSSLNFFAKFLENLTVYKFFVIPKSPDAVLLAIEIVFLLKESSSNLINSWFLSHIVLINTSSFTHTGNLFFKLFFFINKSWRFIFHTVNASLNQVHVTNLFTFESLSVLMTDVAHGIAQCGQ